MNNEEAWREVPHFPDYQVSSLGRMRSKRGRKSGQWKILKERIGKASRKGNLLYRYVAMYNDQGRTDRLLHLVVLESFIGPRPENLQARHLNGNCADNSSANLAWGTVSENASDKKKHKTHCINGHLYIPDNVSMRWNGKRYTRACRLCHNEKTLKAYYDRKSIHKSSQPLDVQPARRCKPH